MKAPLPENEAQRLSALRSYQILDTGPEAAFDDLTLLAAQICETPIALISLVDEKRQWFKSKVGLTAAETSRDVAFCAHAILHTDRLLEVKDALDDPRFADNALVTSDPHVRSYAGAPLLARDGHALGTLCVIDRKPRTLSKNQLAALRALSRHVVSQIELRSHARQLSAEVRSRESAEARLTLQNETLTRSQQETSRLLEQAEKSRGALLSILENEQRTTKELARSKEALVASLREKEALLKEVHHRVKNNLQVIASLLRLEGRRIDHDITKSVLAEMQGRIRAMALLHETLYRSGKFATIDLASYLSQLANQSFRSLVGQPGAIRLNLDLAPVQLDIDQAIPCGLIVNELVSNSFKHGFPDGRTGDLWIRLHPTDDGATVFLSVSDSGAGLARDFEVRRQRSLGLQLVSDLARQLQGSLKIGPGPEAVFEVTFSRTRTRNSGEIPRHGQASTA